MRGDAGGRRAERSPIEDHRSCDANIDAQRGAGTPRPGTMAVAALVPIADEKSRQRRRA